MAADKKKAAKAKAAPKKAAAKAAPKKAASKPAAKAAAKPGPIKDRWSKTEILNEIAERTQVSRKQATAIIDELADIIGRHLGKGGAFLCSTGAERFSPARRPVSAFSTIACQGPTSKRIWVPSLRLSRSR